MRDPAFIFRFTAAGPGAPEAVRVRKMVKAALRAYGLRVHLLGRDDDALLEVMAEIVGGSTGLVMKQSEQTKEGAAA